MDTIARDAIVNAGCVLEGEFIFALKKHGLVSSKYINCDHILHNGPALRILLPLMMQPFREEGFDFVAAPGVGAIPLCVGASHVAHYEWGMSQVTHPFTEKNGEGDQVWDRAGFVESIRGRRGIVLEDIMTTGSSAQGTCDQVRSAGAEVAGVSCLWNRGGVTNDVFGAPLHALVTEPVETWNAEDHPHWGEWPLVGNIGHPEYYPRYPGEKITL